MVDGTKNHRAPEAFRFTWLELELVGRSHDDMLAILSQMRLGVVLADERGNVTFVNRECERITGKTHTEFQGRPWQEMCPFDADQKTELEGLVELESAQRSPTTLSMNAGGRR